MPDTIIGQPIDRIDGKAKVTGAARYAGDRRADHPARRRASSPARSAAARIAKVDVKAAQAAPGVRAGDDPRERAARRRRSSTRADRHARPKPQLARGARALSTASRWRWSWPTRSSRRPRRRGWCEVSYQTEAGAYDLAGNRTPRLHAGQRWRSGKPDSSLGDFDERLRRRAPQKVDATYTTPYQSHNPMEPRGEPGAVGRRPAHDPLRRRSWSMPRTIRSPRRSASRSRTSR